MKLPRTVPLKFTAKKFNGLYKYKVVVGLKQAEWFRNGNLVRLGNKIYLSQAKDKEFCQTLLDCLKTLENYKIRVESPWVCFYTDNLEDAEKFATIAIDKVAYVQVPRPGTEHLLDNGIVLTKSIPYKYRITVGRTRQDYPDLVKWIETVGGKISESVKNELLRPRGYWGGGYFYVKDDRCVTVARLMLGDAIRKVEEVAAV